MPEERSNNGGLKGIGVVLTLIALITGIAAIVRPMQNEITSLNNRISRLELRIDKQITVLNNKVDNQISIFNKQQEKYEQNINNYFKDQLKHQKEALQREVEFLTETINRHIDGEKNQEGSVK